MRVICIDEKCGYQKGVPHVVKGNIYHVLESEYVEKHLIIGQGMALDGVYYNLVETGCWHHYSLFIEINENQKDEEQLLQERIEKVVINNLIESV